MYCFRFTGFTVVGEEAFSVPRRNGALVYGRVPLSEKLALMPLLRAAQVFPSTLLLFPVIQNVDRGDEPFRTLDGARVLLFSCIEQISQ